MRFFPFALAAVVSTSAWCWADPASTTSPTIDLTPDNTPTVSAANAVDTVREGTHFVARTGRLDHTSDRQQPIITFDSDIAGTKSSSMIVMPNLNLYSMESAATAKGAPIDFRISGMVTEYKGKNYILLDNVQTTLASPAAPAVTTSPPPARPKPKSTQAPIASQQLLPGMVAVTNESAATKMDRLLAPLPNAGNELPVVADLTPATNVTTGTAAVAPDAPVLKVMREGTHLTERIGRLNHTPDGSQAIFTFDADGKTMSDPPMVILPNLKLASMEGQVLGRAGDLHFRISGTVTEYKGRNYILLDKAVAIADVETQF
jgi:hypothetical protein